MKLRDLLEASGHGYKASRFADDEGNEYSVEKAYRIAQSRPGFLHRGFPISKLQHDLVWWEDDPGQHRSHMLSVDTSYPLLVLVDADGYHVADGLNRLKKARDVEKRRTIDVYLVPWTDKTKAMVRESAGPSLTFRAEHRNSYSGQSDLTLYAFDNGEPAGRIDYTAYRGGIHIRMIEVPEDKRRRGYGTALAKRLQAEHPEVEIDWGGLTPDGSALHAALPRRAVVDQEITAKVERLKKLRHALTRLDKLADAFYARDQRTPEQIERFRTAMDRWNDIHDEAWELEQELGDQKPSRSLIVHESTGVDPITSLIELARRSPSFEIFKQAIDTSRQGQVYRARNLADAIEMRHEGGSLADYHGEAQREWLGGMAPPRGPFPIYRATPDGRPIMPGDYVSQSLAYVRKHIAANLGGQAKITSCRATLADLFPADGPNEFWYAPAALDGYKSLREFYDKAH